MTVHLETDSERVARTLQLRHIGKLIGQLSVNAGDAMRLLWKDLSHDETIAFEDLDLAKSDLSGGHPDGEELGRPSRRTDQHSCIEKRHQAQLGSVCLYGLGLSRTPRFHDFARISAYVSALDQLKDDNLRLNLKRSRSRASLKKIEKISALFEGVHAALVNMLERLESERDNRRAAAEGDLAMNKPREVHDVIVMAALQELEAVRRYLDELGFSREEGVLGNRMIETFQLSTSGVGASWSA